MDSLVKDYLMYRGYTASLKALDNDMKNDKDKNFKVINHIYY